MLKLGIQLFGEDVEITEELATEETTENVDADSEQSEQVESVTMTQAVLDALIAKEKGKATRKAKREVSAKTTQKKTEQPEAEQSSESDELAAKAEEKLTLANKRLVKGSVLVMGNDLLTENGQKIILQTENFEDCFDEDGDLNDDDVKEKIEEFIKTYPEFNKKEESPQKVVIPPAGKVENDPHAWNPKARELAAGRQLNSKFRRFD